jgi:hypothetical protein
VATKALERGQDGPSLDRLEGQFTVTRKRRICGRGPTCLFELAAQVLDSLDEQPMRPLDAGGDLLEGTHQVFDAERGPALSGSAIEAECAPIRSVVHGKLLQVGAGPSARRLIGVRRSRA